MEVVTSEFIAAIEALAKESKRSDADLITSMGRITLRSLNYNTPIRRRKGTGGALRAGWWDAWIGLGMNGQPVSRPRGRRVRYVGEGGFTDRRSALNPSVTLINSSYVEIKGEEVAYGVDINEGRRGAANQGWFERGLNEAAEKIQKKAFKEYARTLRRANRGK